MRIAFFTWMLCFVTSAHAVEWVPPENAQPDVILREANADRSRGDYEIALAKHVWFHENATRLQPAQTGVRLSFALASWLKLGEAHPPALKKLKDVRDATEARIRDESKTRVRFEDFHDFTALNRTLREEKKTADTFAWLHETHPEDAARVFDISRPALIRNERIELCGEYMDANHDWNRIRDRYLMSQKRFAQFGVKYQEYAEKNFLNDVATLIAIMVATKRKEDSQLVAAKATQFVKGDLHKRLRDALEPALEGKVPAPWP